ncbi:MAG: hypothetical protein JWQ01_4934 [Massilia sp.]|nr:hypothetical protein [Massilia sp.]
MAKLPTPPAENKNDLDGEANDRLAECRAQKTQFDLDIRECYFFSAPQRHRNINSTTPPSQSRTRDEAELQTSLAFELAQDFVTVVLNAFMPESEPWCERRAGMLIPEQVWKDVADNVRKGDLRIFEAMKGSNLYPEIAKAFYPDLAIGTVALWIEDAHPGQPLVVSAVPLRELEINLGPFGEVDDRFIVRHTKNRYVRALLPGITIPQEIAAKIDKKPNDRTELRWGFWRKWADRSDEVWQHVVMIGNKVVHSVEMRGEGCCPLIVGRFNPSADWVYGAGPLMQALPDLRQVDELQGQKISHVELSLTPPLSYPDDSFAAVEGGLECGMAYPVRVGSEGAIKPIYTPGSPEAAIYQSSEMEHRLRKMFFLDFPEQRGDTPPTATQWLDEMQMSQRRLGTPGLPFWREVPAKIFLRFKYLLEAAGTIEPVKVDGKSVALQAYNPAQRAAEQQDVAMSARYIQLMGAAFPEEFKVQVDGKKTMENFKSKMRETLVEFRDEKAVAGAVEQIQKLVGGKHAPGADPAAANVPGMA